MTTTSSTAKLDADRDHAAIGHWPVFARLPDVSDHLPPAARQPARSTASGERNYRFDPPEKPTGGERFADNEPADTATPASTTGSQAVNRPPQPYLLQRAGRRDNVARPPRGKSRILPRSDLFALPDTASQDTLARVVHFLVLVVLFTAAGTFVLTIGKRSQPTPKGTHRTSTAVEHMLQPTAIVNGLPPSLDDTFHAPSVAGPTAAAAATFGESAPEHSTPAGSNAAPTGGDVGTSRFRAPPHDDFDDNNAGDDAHATFEPSAAPVDAQRPALDLRLPPPTDSNSSPWPQVRTTDPPRTVARLQGTVEQVPTRQAKNDDDQSSVH